MSAQRVVYLHVGLMKSGTSFVQDKLAANHDRLAERGVLWPGREWQDQVAAAEELVGIRAAGQPSHPHGSWRRLVDEIDAWHGPSAVVSMEFLSFASPQTARRAAASFGTRRVEVVVTARDLARVIPAQWQEAVQNRATIDYPGYVDGVLGRVRRPRPSVRHFWRAQNLPRVLRNWSPSVDRVTVVTVPPRGSSSALLWDRFCRAIAVDALDLSSGSWSNESLGAASAELMRRVNVHTASSGVGWSEYDQAFKWLLAKDVLAQRRQQEATLRLDARDTRRAAALARLLTLAVQRHDVRVVGSLDELVPGPAAPSAAEGTGGRRIARLRRRDPATDEEVLQAAVAALHEVALRTARTERSGDIG